jgi:hypothetical protein
MHGTKWKLGLLAAGLAILGLVLLVQRLAAAQLRDEVNDLRRQNQILAGLRAEHALLAGQQAPAEELQRLRDDHDALIRLRQEIELLKRRQENVALPKATTPSQPPIRLLACDWTNAGRATPPAAFESMLWAATHGDIDALTGMLDFQQSRSQLEALFAGLSAESRARYGSAEKVFATLLASQISSAVGAMSMIPQGKPDRADAEAIRLMARLESPDGRQQRIRSYIFFHTTDGWRMLVQPGMVESCATLLNGATAAPTPADQPKTDG